MSSNSKKLISKETFEKEFSSFKSQLYQDPANKRPCIYSWVAWNSLLIPWSTFTRESFLFKTKKSIPVNYRRSIHSIAWNPTGALIATASLKTIRVWNPDKPRISNSTELRGHGAGEIRAIGWHPVKEAELASVSSDGTCKFWDVRSKTCISTVQLGGEGWTLCWAADGSVVMVGRKVWLTRTRREK